MNHDDYSDAYIASVLRAARTVAVVGLSPKQVRPSFFVAKYLQAKGYRVIPVNPGQAGAEILGETVYASLSEIPEPVDMVDVFRNSEAAGAIADEAIAIAAKSVWMQLGVRNDAAAARAEAAGLMVVMNRCPKMEYGRLSGEQSWLGVASRTISSKRRLMARGRVQALTLPDGG